MTPEGAESNISHDSKHHGWAGIIPHAKETNHRSGRFLHGPMDQQGLWHQSSPRWSTAATMRKMVSRSSCGERTPLICSDAMTGTPLMVPSCSIMFDLANRHIQWAHPETGDMSLPPNLPKNQDSWRSCQTEEIRVYYSIDTTCDRCWGANMQHIR